MADTGRLLSWLLFLLVALAVWLPGGFNIGPINDGWVMIAYDRWLDPGAGTRVLQLIPMELGLHLTPGDFAGWQWLLLVLTVARAILVFEIVERLLDGQRAYALACGLLALFHPMDTSYFWVDAINVGMAYALTLAACLAALLHLQSCGRTSLAAMWALQVLACFTYTGFVPILAAFPLLFWLLWRLDGRSAAPVYLLECLTLPVLFFGLMVLEARHGQGRESRVASLGVGDVLAGYAYQLRTLGQGWLAWVQKLDAAYLLPAAIAGGIGLAVAWRTTARGQSSLRPLRFYLLLAAGLVAMALGAYLPYAVSELRIGHIRQMLAAGLFLLMALLLPLFLYLASAPSRRRAAAVLVGLLAFGTAITGAEMRRGYLDIYRAQEAFLSSIASVVPYPPADSFIVVEPGNDMHGRDLGSLRNRYPAFTSAVQHLYGDASLQAVFGGGDAALSGFTRDGVTVSGIAGIRQFDVPYARLILLQYQDDGTVRVVDPDSLRRQAPAGSDISGYRPGPYGGAPGPDSDVCRMLEAAYRPAYCH